MRSAGFVLWHKVWLALECHDICIIYPEGGVHAHCYVDINTWCLLSTCLLALKFHWCIYMSPGQCYNKDTVPPCRYWVYTLIFRHTSLTQQKYMWKHHLCWTLALHTPPWHVRIPSCCRRQVPSDHHKTPPLFPVLWSHQTAEQNQLRQ